jgi:hypothetical protein
MTQDNNKEGYIQIVNTSEYYYSERKFHEDAIKDIDEQLRVLDFDPLYDPLGFDVAGVKREVGDV